MVPHAIPLRSCPIRPDTWNMGAELMTAGGSSCVGETPLAIPRTSAVDATDRQ